MAVIFNRAALISFFETGKAPNQAQFTALINSFSMKYSETVTLSANTDQSITHSMGENAGIVQVIDSGGVAVGVNWRLDAADPTNKVIINSGKAYSGASVTILSK